MQSQALECQCFCHTVRFRICPPESAVPEHKQNSFTAVIWPSQLQILEGQDRLHTLTWGEPAFWRECSACRTRLFYGKPPGEEIYVDMRAIGDVDVLPSWLALGPSPGKLVKLLHRAAKLGCRHQLQLLLDKGVAVDSEHEGRTALELAAQDSRLSICRILLEHGADVRRARRDSWWTIPEDRLRPMVRLLLEYGYPAQDLLLPIMDTGSVRALALLLKQPIDLNQWDEEGRTLLQRACSANIVRLLLQHGADVTRLGRENSHALVTFASLGRTGSLKALLEGGFPPDLMDEGKPGPALCCACGRGHIESVRWLLHFGANPNQDQDGLTPLMQACRYGSPTMVDLLLKAGANPQAQDQQGRTALDWARMALPDLLSRARSWGQKLPGDEPVHHSWGRNSAGERTLRVRRGKLSLRWTDGHAAIVKRLDPNYLLPPTRARPVPPETSLPLEGGCSCGHLRFRLNPPEPDALSVPAVLSSQKLVGLRESQFEVLSGVDSMVMHRDDEQASNWWRCARCRQQEIIFRTPEAPGCRYVKLKQLDRPIDARRIEQLYLSEPLKPGQNWLHRAARNGDTRRVAALIARGWPLDVEIDGWTPLQKASNRGNFRTARLLLRHGADARKAIVIDGNSSLDALPQWLNTLIQHGYPAQKSLGWVVECGTPAAVRVLLRAGANLDQPDDEGIQPLHLAAHNGCAMLRFVMGAGADPTLLSEGGGHALGFCALWGYAGRARALLESGFPVNLPQSDGPDSALFAAAGQTNINTVRVLLEFGADPNLGCYEQTPLMVAAARGSLELVNVLLEAGADPRLRDDQGKTALDYAESADSPEYCLRQRLSES